MGERIEHQVARSRAGSEKAPSGGPCCDLHGRNCAPPSDLCCWRCTEAGHVWAPVPHSDGSVCSNPDLSGSGLSSLPPSFTCPECRAVSYHPDDIRHRYCGACSRWTGDPDDPTPRSPRREPPPRSVAPYDYGTAGGVRLDVDTVTGRWRVRPVTDLDRAGLAGEAERGPLDRMTVTASPNALAIALTCVDCGETTTEARRPSPVGMGPPLTVADLVRAAGSHACDPEAGL